MIENTATTKLLGVPNYTTALASGTNGSYTATEDCWFNVYAISGNAAAESAHGKAIVTVNGVMIGSVSRAFTEEEPAAHLLFLLKKNDQVTFSGSMSLAWRVYSTL